MVRDKLITIVRGVLGNASTSVEDIVEHIMSDLVGVTALEDLTELDESSMCPPYLNIPPIKAKRLIKAFHQAAAGGSGSVSVVPQTPASAASAASTSNPPMALLPSIISVYQPYSFTVNWADMPQEAIQNLEKADLERKMGNPEDVSALKLAIAKALKNDYVVWRNAHAGSNKHPPIKVIRSLGDEVKAKFEFACCQIIGGRMSENGMGGFNKALEVAVGNLLRNEKLTSKCTKKAIGRGTVGVLIDKYNPQVLNEEESKSIREKLQKLSKELLWDEDEIMKDMGSSYDLQREDILAAKEKIHTSRKELDADDPEPLALAVLMDSWPFLFELQWAQQHHQTLTGKDLRAPLLDFSARLDSTLLYLGSIGESKAKNLALRANLEDRGDLVDQKGIKLLLAVHMIANHLKENISDWIKTAEKTTQMSSLDTTILEHHKDPCIVALDTNPFLAKKFWVCADKICLITVENFEDALLCYFYLCFNLDLNYPSSMPKLFEFIERYVFTLAFHEGRVKPSRGVTLLFVTNAVKTLSKDIDDFERNMATETLKLQEAQ